MAFRPFALLLLCAFGFVFKASAQVTDPFEDKDSTVVTGKWEGNLKDLQKPRLQLPAVKIQTQTQGLTYEQRDLRVETSFTPRKPGRPKAPGKSPMPKLHGNFIKLGFGRFITPMARLYLSNTYNEQLNASLDLNHLSASKGQVEYAEFRENHGTATVDYLLKDHSMGGSVYVNNTNFFYYADSILAENPQFKDSLRQTFTKIQATAYLKKNYKSDEINWGASLRFRDYIDRLNNQDLHVTFAPNLNWAINDDFGAGMDLNLTFSNSRFDSVAQSRFFLDFTPTATYTREKFRAKAGLKVNTFNDSTTSFGAYPILRAEYDAVPKHLTVFAGMQGEMKYNNFYDLTTQNRYLRTRDVQPDIRPTREKFNVYGGASGSISQYLDYSVKGYYKIAEDQLMFYNMQDGAYFDMVYDSLYKEGGAELSLIFNKDDKIRAGVDGLFRDFQTQNIEDNFAMPRTQMQVWGSYNFAEKLWITSEVYVIGKRTMTVDSVGMPITRNALADVNLYADYRFNKRISVFLELNNILNNEYYRWYNYLERPFDIKAGVTATF